MCVMNREESKRMLQRIADMFFSNLIGRHCQTSVKAKKEQINDGIVCQTLYEQLKDLGDNSGAVLVGECYCSVLGFIRRIKDTVYIFKNTIGTAYEKLVCAISLKSRTCMTVCKDPIRYWSEIVEPVHCIAVPYE